MSSIFDNHGKDDVYYIEHKIKENGCLFFKLSFKEIESTKKK